MSNPISKKQLLREVKLELSRRSFWEFCKVIAPDFYKEERTHLKELANTLQALYECRIVKYIDSPDWSIVDVLNGLEIAVCKKLMINMPPQHGKSRTLINFYSWVYGKNPHEKIINASYNDSVASDFSRYTRDAIDTKRTDVEDIVYSDIFPLTKIKKGNAGFEKWALEGSHFSYLGAGIGGSITGKGATILGVDDPIKSAEDSMNENNLDRIWLWYTSTFLSRVSADQGQPVEIVNMTRWSDKDICGRILESQNKADWYVLKMVAYDEKTDTMLCPSLLNKKRFDDLKILTDPVVFNANYLQEPGSKTGVLFKEGDLKYFSLKDYKKDGKESTLGYIDVADSGDDNLAFPLGDVFRNKVFITDVIFTQAGIDETLPMCASLLKSKNVYDEKKVLIDSFNVVRVESNNQGKVFARDLRTLCGSEEKIWIITNSQNKNTRIRMQYGFIKNYFYFRNDYEPNSDYARFMKELKAYMKNGTSKHDDAPDAIAGLAKLVRSIHPELFSELSSVEGEEDVL